MKIAVIVIGSLAVLILTVLVIGALLPKHHIATRSATFRAKPERLFALISGPPTWRPWRGSERWGRTPPSPVSRVRWSR